MGGRQTHGWDGTETCLRHEGTHLRKVGLGQRKREEKQAIYIILYYYSNIYYIYYTYYIYYRYVHIFVCCYIATSMHICILCVSFSMCVCFICMQCSLVHPQVSVMYSYMCFFALCISRPICICIHIHCYIHVQTQICEIYLYREERTRGINSTEARAFLIIPYNVHLEIIHVLHNLKNKLQ